MRHCKGESCSVKIAGISTNNNILQEGEEVHIKTCEMMDLHVQLTNAHGMFL